MFIIFAIKEYPPGARHFACSHPIAPHLGIELFHKSLKSRNFRIQMISTKQTKRVFVLSKVRVTLLFCLLEQILQLQRQQKKNSFSCVPRKIRKNTCQSNFSLFVYFAHSTAATQQEWEWKASHCSSLHEKGMQSHNNIPFTLERVCCCFFSLFFDSVSVKQAGQRLVRTAYTMYKR